MRLCRAWQPFCSGSALTDLWVREPFAGEAGDLPLLCRQLRARAQPERDRSPRTSIDRGREMKLSARDLLRQCPAACPPSMCSVSPVTNVASSR